MQVYKKQMAYNYSRRNSGIYYIVVHDTGNTARGSGAENHYNYFNGGDRQSSADIFVDDHSEWIVNDYHKYYSWHCGDGHGKYGISNSNSVGVEMCINSDGNYEQAFANTVEVVKGLMGELGIDINHVVRHYDASRKNCPGSMSGNNWAKWWEFKDRLSQKKQVSFPDTDGHFAKAHIDKLLFYNVVNGYEDGTFRPNATVSRAEFSTMISNALENACGYNLKSAGAFPDVNGHWAESYIKKITACGIVNGFEDGTFRPDEAITRGQAAMMGCNMLLYCGVEMKAGSGFADTSGHYAERHITTLKEYGVVNGDDTGLFRPDDPISRAEAAIIVANCLTVVGK